MARRPIQRDLGLCLLVMLMPTLAFAASDPAVLRPSVNDPATTPQLLEIWTNGHSRHIVASIIERKGNLFMSTDDITASGLVLRPDEIPPSKLTAINHIYGIVAQIDLPDQRLLITAQPDRLTTQDFDLTVSSDADKAVSDTGFIGSYDVVTTAADFNHPGDTTSAGANLGGTLFTPDGIINATGFTQSQTDRAFTRLDTTAEFDQPSDMRRWLAGDTATGSLNWSRSVRVAGFQMASDFSMRPDLNTMPLPVFFGQTALPSTVDVYVNAARVFENNVDAGPFQINNLPIMTGSGQVSVVTRDALGQQTVTTLPFYASNQLLKPGLESYAFDLGFIRENYGLSSFSYSEPATTGTYSRGINDWLTLESHGEAVHNLQLGGGGAVFSLGTFGVMHAALAGSHFDDQDDEKYGSLYSLSLETQQHPVGFFASAAKTLGPYADVASLGSDAVPSLQTQVGGSLGLEKNGSFSLSWIRTKTDAAEPAELVSGSYTVSFAQRWNFGLTSFYDITNHASVSEALLSFSFEDGTIANSASRLARNNNQQEVDVLKPVSVDGGMGYHVATAVGQPALAEGDVNWINSRGNFDGALSSQNGVQSGRLTASGGVVAMGGSLYATQYPNGAVALVRTGQPFTHIYHENRDAGESDEDGEALLTNFTPYTANRIGVDPLDYDLSSTVDTGQKIIVPRRQSGVVVDLTPTQHLPALVVLRRENGDFPPMGSRVTLDNASEPTVVGLHGEVYLTDVPKAVKGNVSFDSGSCHFVVQPPPRKADDPIPRIDPVACVMDSAS